MKKSQSLKRWQCSGSIRQFFQVSKARPSTRAYFKITQAKQNTGKIQFLKSIALHFYEKTDDAINNLKKLRQTNSIANNGKNGQNPFLMGYNLRKIDKLY